MKQITDASMFRLLSELYELPEYKRKQFAILLMGTTLTEEAMKETGELMSSVADVISEENANEQESST